MLFSSLWLPPKEFWILFLKAEGETISLILFPRMRQASINQGKNSATNIAGSRLLQFCLQLISWMARVQPKIILYVLLTKIYNGYLN